MNYCATMTLATPGRTERRQSPRYEIDLLAEIILDNGDAFTASAHNISSTGMKIVCDSWVTDQIEPRGIQSHAVNHIHFKVVTELPLPDGKEKLYANCRIMSLQRLSQNKFMLNLVFIGFENNSESLLDKFLEQCLQKKTVVKAYV